MYRFQPVLEVLRNKSKTDFEKAFGEDYGSDTGISYQSFKELLKRKLGLELKDCDIYHLFCQIDRYSKEKISSTELNAYLDEYEKKRMLPAEGPFDVSPTMHPGVRCHDSIIDWILYPEEPGVTNEMAGHYVYVSRSGVLSVLTRDTTKRFETTIETVDDGETGKTSTWATSITCFPKERLLAVSTTSGDIRFFRSSIYKFEHKFSIVCLPYIVLRLQCYTSQMLVCGDFSGSVYMIHISESFFSKNRQRASHLSPEKIRFDNLKAGKVSGMSYEGTSKAHYSPVQQIEYIPSLMAVISCSTTTKRAMMIHSLENNENLSFKVPGGINCFAFCQRRNCIATGGADHTVKVWNPSVNATCNESLTGHTSPITHVLVSEDRLFLISFDREKTMRVWDLLRSKCLQIIQFEESHFPGRQSFASTFQDPSNGCLILTTYQIGTLELYQKVHREKTHPCSEYIILAAYSNVYNCLVTVGNSSTVAVWDAMSGSLIYEYENSHEITNSNGFSENVSVTAAGLDPSHRRLVTADRIGTVKVWNFHLGLCLRSFKTIGVVLALSFVGFHIYAAGSSGIIVDLYDNGSENVEPLEWEKCYERSIVSLDYYRQNLLVSASIDGKIAIWHRKCTDPKLQFKDLKEDQENVKVDDLAKVELEKRRKCSISQILFLQKREMDFFVGNLVSCGMDGRIRFWNIVYTQKIHEGKLLSKFKAVFRECDGILCLATDTENRYLISGDTMGYIRVYELDSYYDSYGSAPPSVHKASSKQLAKFPFLRMQERIDKKHPEHSKFAEDASELGFTPFLLNCFRAHLTAVLKVSFVDEKDILITAGKDSSVRLWNISGTYIGRLGPSEEPLNFVEEKINKSNIPPDVKIVASSLTLFVMNNGATPHWTRALEALRKCRLGHQPEGFTAKPAKWKLKKSVSAEELSITSNTLEEELIKRLKYFRGTRVCNRKSFDDV